jgi:hypothetical protein
MSRMHGTAKLSNMTIYPPVIDYGEDEMETFDYYFARWPKSLSSIPKEVIQDWIYRHWPQFNEYWSALRPHTWSYKRVQFSADELLTIENVSPLMLELDAESLEYEQGGVRSETPLADYMFANGTFPMPIIVAENAGHVVHPRGDGEQMKVPFQLIEGHSRLACIRSMIRSGYPTLQPQHDVWVVTIP